MKPRHHDAPILKNCAVKLTYERKTVKAHNALLLVQENLVRKLRFIPVCTQRLHATPDAHRF